MSSSSEESEIDPPSFSEGSSDSETENESLAVVAPPRVKSREELQFDTMYDRFEEDHGKKLSRAERKRVSIWESFGVCFRKQ